MYIPLGEDILVFFAFSLALYDGCLDHHRTLVLSEEELLARAALHARLRWPADQPTGPAAVRAIITYYRYLYTRARELLESGQDSSLSTLATALPALSEAEGLTLVKATARRLLSEGAMRTWLHPLLLLPSTRATKAALALALFSRCFYPTPSAEEISQMQATAQEIFGEALDLGLLTESDAATYEQFQPAFEAGFALFSSLFARHTDLLAALTALFKAGEVEEGGIFYALGWLTAVLRPRTDGTARHALLLLDQFFPREALEPFTLCVEDGAHCLLRSCSRAARPIASLQVTLTEGTIQVPLAACHSHRALAAAVLARPSAILHLGWQVAQRTGGTLTADVQVRPHAAGRTSPPPVAPTPPRPLQIQQVLERFRQWARPAPDNAWLHALERLGGEKARWFGLAFGDSFVELARKVDLASGALAVAASLPAPPLEQARERAIAFAPAVWIIFETSLPTLVGPIKGLSFGYVTDQNLAYAQQQVPLSPRQFAAARTLLHPPTLLRVGLTAFDEGGQGVWMASWVHEQGQQGHWVLPPWRPCPDPAGCQEAALCASCLAHLTSLFGLYANCLRLISGELAAQEEPAPREIKRVSLTRKERDPHKLHKFRQRHVEYPLEIVTFNAARKARTRTRPERQGRAAQGKSAGSWIAAADPDTIIWLPYHFAASKRRLKDPRYRHYILAHGGDPDNPDGYEIDVRAFDRKVPMTLRTLQRRLLRVTYEATSRPSTGQEPRP